jgi:hypothetical protein
MAEFICGTHYKPCEKHADDNGFTRVMPRLMCKSACDEFWAQCGDFVEENQYTFFQGILPPRCDAGLSDTFVNPMTPLIYNGPELFVLFAMEDLPRFPEDRYSLQFQDGGEPVEESKCFTYDQIGEIDFQAFIECEAPLLKLSEDGASSSDDKICVFPCPSYMFSDHEYRSMWLSSIVPVRTSTLWQHHAPSIVADFHVPPLFPYCTPDPRGTFDSILI